MVPGQTHQKPNPPPCPACAVRLMAAPKDIALLVPARLLAETDQKYILVMPKSESTNEVNTKASTREEDLDGRFGSASQGGAPGYL